MTQNFKCTILGLLIGLLFGAFFAGPLNAIAAPQLQLTPFPTPTPGPDGRILYQVQPNDTLWRIAAVSGLSLDELRALNNLTGDAIIAPGDTLLLGLGGPAGNASTPEGPAPTALPEASPTPEEGPSTGVVCILLYEDTNGDAIRQDAELGIAEGAISLTDRSGSVSLTAATIAEYDPDDELPISYCFEDVEAGDYNITVAAPEGYNPTTELNYALKLEGGDTAYLDFGAQPSTKAQTEPFQPEALPIEPESRTPILGIAGGVLLVAGIGLAIFAGRLTRRSRVQIDE